MILLVLTPKTQSYTKSNFPGEILPETSSKFFYSWRGTNKFWSQFQYFGPKSVITWLILDLQSPIFHHAFM